jgi:DnaJ-class molecular chaperone
MICPTCHGEGYLRHGHEPGAAHHDVLIIAWRPCRRCSTTGIYVSRARAGLADAGRAAL